jgi:NAD(P)H dehydrogenase (quinone)
MTVAETTTRRNNRRRVLTEVNDPAAVADKTAAGGSKEAEVSKIAIIVGHSRTGTFDEALGEAYVRGANSAGHRAQLFVTSKMQFDPILREGFARPQPLEPDLQAAHDAILGADHLVIIFPLWLGMLPAILKGFIERVLQPDFIEPARQGKMVKILSGKSARIVVTMGMPGLVYRWWYGAHALKSLDRNILRFAGVAPVHSTVYGDIEGVGREGRERWLREVEDMGRRAA